MFSRIFVGAFIACLGHPAKSHEFWIEPSRYQINQGEKVVADLRVGQAFEGSAQSFLPPRFTRFEFEIGRKIFDMPGIIGDRPAISLEPAGEGLLVVVHETTNQKITWSEWEKFENFLLHKDAAWVIAEHDALGYSREKPSEAYSRHAKSLIGVGAAQGADQAFGLLTEFVALENPYTDDIGAEMEIMLLYEGKPRGSAQIEIFERGSDGSVEIFTLATDANGYASIPVKSGHEYMLDAVVLRKAPEVLAKERNVQWQSLWANLTFFVPGN